MRRAQETFTCSKCYGEMVVAPHTAGKDGAALAQCGCGNYTWVLFSEPEVKKSMQIACPKCNNLLDPSYDVFVPSGHLVCGSCGFKGTPEAILSEAQELPAPTTLQRADRYVEESSGLDSGIPVSIQKVILNVAILALDRVDQYLQHRKQLDRAATFLKHYHGDHTPPALEEFQRILDHFGPHQNTSDQEDS